MDDDPTTGIFLARPERVADGIRLAVKDLFDTAGLTTTYGSAIFADHVPDASAEVVRRLEGAGYANVGKTNLHEFAYGITSTNPHFGTVPNPAAPGRIAGGSSGGSAAALAGGFAEAALGTDSGGSIRIPAACCGVVGFKPSYGLVSLDGCFPLAPSFDHAGPMANTVADCVTLMGYLADGFQPQALESLDELEVGIAWVDQGCAAGGRECRRRRFSVPARARARLPAPPRAGAGLHGRGRRRPSRALRRERRPLRRQRAHQGRACLGGQRRRVRQRAVRAREEYRERCEEAFDGLDLLLTPTIPFVPPRLPADDLDLREDMIRFTLPFNALGWPVLALPCGPAEDGLPPQFSWWAETMRSSSPPEPCSRHPSFEGRPGPETCRRPLCMPFARPCAAFFFAVLALGVFAPAASAAKPLPAPRG